MKRLVFAGLAILVAHGVVSGDAHVTKEPIARDGTPVDIDLPIDLHLKNKGGSDGPRGPGSGSGLCVFTSINHSAYWQRVAPLYDFRDWMTHHPGGGYPQKVDAMVSRICQQRSVSKPDYVQWESNNLDLLVLAARTGRMPAVTYSWSPTGRYGGRSISHMVSLVAARAGRGPDSKGWWAVIDNNYPGSYEWMSEAQYLKSYSGGRMGWAVVLLNPSPPPVPYH